MWQILYMLYWGKISPFCDGLHVWVGVTLNRLQSDAVGAVCVDGLARQSSRPLHRGERSALRRAHRRRHVAAAPHRSAWPPGARHVPPHARPAHTAAAYAARAGRRARAERRSTRDVPRGATRSRTQTALRWVPTEGGPTTRILVRAGLQIFPR